MDDGDEAVITPEAAPDSPVAPRVGRLAPPWKPGQSGNPGGWAGPARDAQRIARQNSPKAMLVLVELLDCDDNRVRVVAANAILDRAMGKPKEPMPERDGGRRLDFSGLSPAELAEMRRLLGKVGAAPPGM